MKRLTIRFPSDQSDDFYARAFWFAESLHHPIIHAGIGSMSDVDRMRDVLWIDLKNNHDLGKVKEIVRKALARYRLTADATVTIDSVPPPKKSN